MLEVEVEVEVCLRILLLQHQEVVLLLAGVDDEE
jgi:hypothetical protein